MRSTKVFKMRKNNFKELEKERMEEAGSALHKIKSNVNSNLGVFQFIGEMIELFLPRVLQLFTQGDENGERFPKNKYPNRPE